LNLDFDAFWKAQEPAQVAPETVVTPVVPDFTPESDEDALPFDDEPFPSP